MLTTLQYVRMFLNECGDVAYLILFLCVVALVLILRMARGRAGRRARVSVWATTPLLIAALGALGTSLGMLSAEHALGWGDFDYPSLAALLYLRITLNCAMLGAGLGGALLVLGAIAARVAASRQVLDAPDVAARAQVKVGAGLGATVGALLLGLCGWTLGLRNSLRALEWGPPGDITAGHVIDAMATQRVSLILGGGLALGLGLFTLKAINVHRSALQNRPARRELGRFLVGALVVMGLYVVPLPLSENPRARSTIGKFETGGWARTALPVNRGAGRQGLTRPHRNWWRDTRFWPGDTSEIPAWRWFDFVVMARTPVLSLASDLGHLRHVTLRLNESDRVWPVQDPRLDVALIGDLDFGIEHETPPDETDLQLTGPAGAPRLRSGVDELVYPTMAAALVGIGEQMSLAAAETRNNGLKPRFILVPDEDWTAQDLVSACIAAKLAGTTEAGEPDCVVRDSCPL